jgi:hypothetical protein
VDIQHRSGVTHGDADELSRNPLPSEEDQTDARMHHDSHVTSVTAGLALLACVGIEAIKTAADRLEFGGTEKDEDPQATESGAANSASRDAWQDEAILAYIRTGSHAPGLTAAVKDRVQHRAKHYLFENNLLRKRMPAGVDKIVPESHLHANLIRATHLITGHFGIKKTYSLLEPVYTWAGMYEQVRLEVRACAACDRVKASFKVRDTVLKSLSIMGLFYRWGVDLCKMPHPSKDGNKYVVIMIEHFTKWVELVPIPEKSSFYTAAALKGVLTRFGAPAEVLTDQGEEFQGEFAALLQKLLIDHRTTSWDHPQSDKLAKRMVQVVKEALRKYCLTFNKQHWCRFFCWIAMGYRMSRQRSLGGYSPYLLLFGRWPIVGASVRDVLQKVVVTVGRDIAACRLTMCRNHGFALQLAYGIAC